jgi:uncharacterized membrane protein
MHFAYPLPWWAIGTVAAAIAALVIFEYRRPLAPLTRVQRGVLIACRATALAAVVLFLCRPILLLPPLSARDTVVPVLVDVSRSMRLRDVDGQARIARATTLLRTQVLPALSREFRPEIYSVGERLAPADLTELGADARQTDLAGALAAVRERYRGQHVPGIIVLSDGGDTSQQPPDAAAAAGPPVFAVGIGSRDGVRDREVLGLTAGDPRLDQSSIDLHVSAISTGFGRTPFPLRVLANGRVLESRRIVPPADGSPVDETFTVSPDPLTPTVYTADIPVDESEPVVENNTRSVLVSPAGRKRRVLIIEGAPGFEHSFMKRALAHDTSLDVDSVVRKGKNAEGQDTFFVQAAAGRTSALMTGFPLRREDLYAYDALIVANVEGDFFTRAQLAMTADFVAERGGGLLVLGGRSLTSRGLIGTALEEALPVELTDRRGSIIVASLAGRDAAAHNKLAVTPEGESHPIMRIAGSREDSLKAWSALPPLAASARLGGPRPGASVLAVTEAPGGGVFPVVAIQRYGQGRSMVFAGEASWRWKMLVASADRTHEFFWRQAARWLARPSPDPVAITVPDGSEPGDSIPVDVDARDAQFAPVADATVDATLTMPGEAGEEARPLTVHRAAGGGGRFTTAIRAEQPGLYRVRAEARRGAAVLGTADRWFYVGGADRELADPRLNEGFLRRVSRASGGRYVPPGEAGQIVSSLRSAVPQNAAPERRDLWHTPWALAFVIALLSAEWTLRRRWGLR